MPSHTPKERKKKVVAAGFGGLSAVTKQRSAAAKRVTATRKARVATKGAGPPFAFNRPVAPPASSLPPGTRVKGRKVKRVTIARAKTR